MKRKKRDGFIFIISLLLIIVVFVISMAMSRLSVGNTINISSDDKSAADYYIAKSGIEMIYGALVQENPNLNMSNGKSSIIEVSGPYRLQGDRVTKSDSFLAKAPFDKSGTLINKQKFQINDGSGKNVGECEITLDLYCYDAAELNSKCGIVIDTTSMTIPDYWCYRIVSKGYAKTKNSSNKDINGHSLTMFVYLLNPTTPKLYDGVIPYKEEVR